MSRNDEAIPQGALDKILARMRETPTEPEDWNPFFIHRIFCHKALVSDHPADASANTSISVYDAIRGTHAPLGSLVSKRRVGSFVVRLVLGREDASDIWRIVETNSRDERVILLTYGGPEDHAREAATQYAADATEVDLTSDQDPAAHFFGERRVSRTSRSEASRPPQ
jgi:hypothetical protein